MASYDQNSGGTGYYLNKALDPGNFFGARGVSSDFGAAPYSTPNFYSPFTQNDPNQGLAVQYQLQNQGALNNRLDTSGLNELQKEALAAPGSSAWEGMAANLNAAQTEQNRDQAMQTAAGQSEGAKSALASSGGLSSGARFNLARNAANQGATASQGVSQQGAINRLGISTQAEQNRLGQLAALPGQSLAAAQYGTGVDTSNRDYATGVQQANINTSLGGINNMNQNNLTTYGLKMQDWAAQNAANATAKGGGKGGGK